MFNILSVNYGQHWGLSETEVSMNPPLSLRGGSGVVFRTGGKYERTLISRVIVQLFTPGKPQFINHQSHRRHTWLRSDMISRGFIPALGGAAYRHLHFFCFGFIRCGQCEWDSELRPIYCGFSFKAVNVVSFSAALEVRPLLLLIIERN